MRGLGSPNSDDWRKSLALCLLCGRSLRIFTGVTNPQNRLLALCGKTSYSSLSNVIQEKWNRDKMGNKGFGNDFYVNFLRKQINAINLKRF